MKSRNQWLTQLWNPNLPCVARNADDVRESLREKYGEGMDASYGDVI